MRDQPFDFEKIDLTDLQHLRSACEQLWYTLGAVTRNHPRMLAHDFHVKHLANFLSEIRGTGYKFEESLIRECFGDLITGVENRGYFWRVFPSENASEEKLRFAAGQTLLCVVVAGLVGQNDYMLSSGYDVQPTTESEADNG